MFVYYCFHGTDMVNAKKDGGFQKCNKGDIAQDN